MSERVGRFQLEVPSPKQLGWPAVFRRTFERIGDSAALGGLAVIKANVNADGVATDRKIILTSGPMVGFDNKVYVKPQSPPIDLPANTIQYIYLDQAYDFQRSEIDMGEGTAGHIPLARVTIDSTKIVTIEDMRNPLRIIDTPYYNWRLGFVDSTDFDHTITDISFLAPAYQLDATAGPMAITLPPLAGVADMGMIFLAVKADDSANPVTISPAPGDAGPVVTLAAQYDACFLSTGAQGGAWIRLRF